jgi:hypothetical protein
VTETRHGFHLLFRVQPQREPKAVEHAEAVNRHLVRVLRGDPHAALLTQLLRVPGSLQFKLPSEPFLCRLLVDNSAAIPPYSLAAVCEAVGCGGQGLPAQPAPVGDPPTVGVPRWRRGLAGAAEGERNATAASLVGKIFGRLPEELWETAGWGGLKEWNSRNAIALPEQELRSVFESIARRERARRRTARRGGPLAAPTSATARALDFHNPSPTPDAQH